MIEKSTRGFGSPSRYFQGPGEVNNLKSYTDLFGSKVFALIDIFFYADLSKKLKELYTKAGGAIETEQFGGEATLKEIERVTALAAQAQAQVVVGIGGGKTLDTAKAMADNLKIPIVVLPTTASTDAPCSALSVIYHENGMHSHERFYIKNPDIVLVDSEIIAKAPVKFLVAGMGDALSTYFEARANNEADNPNFVNAEKSGGFRRPKVAMALAKLCYDLLLEDGLKAKMAAEAGVVTEALENIIEANTLLSGLGFENTGCAGAHSVNDGIIAVPPGDKVLHGIRVAFGTIVQLVAEGRPMRELQEVIEFCISVGLPVMLEDMGIPCTPENAWKIAETSMHSLWHCEPFKVRTENVYAAIMSTNALGKHFKEKAK